MTLAQVQQLIAHRLVLKDIERVPNDTLRLLSYETRDRRWTIGVFGSPGRERVARIVSAVPGTRTNGGVGVGTPVLSLPKALRVYRPVCVQRQPDFNYILHRLQVVSCGIRTRGATTAFLGGPPSCAAKAIRYQGCERIRIAVGRVMIEDDRLREIKLSWWYPVTVIPPPIKTVEG